MRRRTNEYVLRNLIKNMCEHEWRLESIYANFLTNICLKTVMRWRWLWRRFAFEIWETSSSCGIGSGDRDGCAYVDLKRGEHYGSLAKNNRMILCHSFRLSKDFIRWDVPAVIHVKSNRTRFVCLITNMSNINNGNDFNSLFCNHRLIPGTGGQPPQSTANALRCTHAHIAIAHAS